MFGLRLDEEINEIYEGLHAEDCIESIHDLDRMRKRLDQDTGALERTRMPFLSSPLRDAAASGHPKCVRFLIEHGAALNSEDRRGSIPLDAAVATGNVACVLSLLRAGANPNHQALADPRNSRTSCLTRACTDGRADIVNALLTYNAMTEDIPETLPDYLLCTPASTAVSQGYPDCLRLLLLYGALIDLSPILPERPILVARHSLIHLCLAHTSRHGTDVSLATLTLLRQFGADMKQKDVNGLTALQVYASKLDSTLLSYLAKLEANPLTLLELTRCQLHKILGRRYMQILPSLEIPISLMHFLQFHL